MPKEQINFPNPAHEVEDLGTGERTSAPMEPRLRVHWSSAEQAYVALSIDIDWETLQEYVDKRRENPDAYWGEHDDRYELYTDLLDRADLQRLIKHTRRARDAVYGADE